MFRPIYEPRTRAKEYSDLAINIYTGCSLAAGEGERIETLKDAAKLGIKTWVSFEPVCAIYTVLDQITKIPQVVSMDTLLKIGKLNHHTSAINWEAFGQEAERICKENGWNYYIKEDLRAEMERVSNE